MISDNCVLKTVWESIFRRHGSWYELLELKVSYPKVADDNAAGYTVDSQDTFVQWITQPLPPQHTSLSAPWYVIVNKEETT